MLPSVAAILCNKKMVRPSKGMPIEWRKSFHSGRGPLRKAKAIIQELWAVAKHDKITAMTLAVTGTVATVGMVHLIKWLTEPITDLPKRYQYDEDKDPFSEDEDEEELEKIRKMPWLLRWLVPNPRKVRKMEFEYWLDRDNKEERYYGTND